jgi:hypothetical protein
VFSSGAFKTDVLDFMLSSGRFGSNSQAIMGVVDEKIYPYAISQVWIFVVMFGGAAALVALRLAGKFSAKAFSWCAVAAVAVDLFVFGRSYATGRQDPSRVYAESALVRQLLGLQKKEFFRINSRDSNPGTDDLGGRAMIFQKNQGSVHRLFLMEGYNPLRLRRQLVDRKEKTLDILNVKYAIAAAPGGRGMGLAERRTYLPRASMVYGYEVEPEEEKILERLHAPEFDHTAAVILDREPVGLRPAAGQADTSWSCRITRYGLNMITVDARTGRDGLLLLSEIHYPSWKARIDGEETQVYRADYALRAVVVPEGEHTVEFYFSSDAFRAGALVSAAFAAAVFGGMMFAAARRKAARPAPGGTAAA